MMSFVAAARFHHSHLCHPCPDAMTAFCALALALAACALLTLALFLAIPVAVNWPDSVLGGFLITAALLGAGFFGYKAAMLSYRGPAKTPTTGPDP
jgi:hypothetical protein